MWNLKKTKTKTKQLIDTENRDWCIAEMPEVGSWGVGEMNEVGQKVQTSSFKINVMGM